MLLDRNRVGEDHARRAVLTLSALVDVSGCLGQRLVLAPEAIELNAIANGVGIRDDTVVEGPTGALESTGEGDLGTGPVHDLVGGGLDAVARREDLCGTIPLATALAVIVNLVPVNGLVVDLAILEGTHMLVYLCFE